MSRLFRQIPRLAPPCGADLRVGALVVLRALTAGGRPPLNLLPGRSAGRCGGRPARRPEVRGRTLHGLGRALGLLLFLLIGCQLSLAAPAMAAPGLPISNIAHLSYNVGGVQEGVDSNLVSLMVRSPATIEFLTYTPQLPTAQQVPIPPTFFWDGAAWLPIPAPPELSGPTLPLAPADLYHAGSPFYLRLTDLDQNTDPASVETVRVTVGCAGSGDSELLLLTETGPATGVFTGFLLSAGGGGPAKDGVLIVAQDSRVSAIYTDPADGTDTTTDAALVDPFGYVFDSLSGLPVDGVLVTLVDLATGLPASAIRGDNGAAGFPARIATGSCFDFGNMTYCNPPGGYRFPLVPPGRYRLDVDSGAVGYTSPTVASDATLQARPWWTEHDYRLTTGSRGEGFEINPGPAIRIDIPIDPLLGYLWLKKSVSKDHATVGDFLQYRLELENASASLSAPATTITDRLPPGFRFQPGSTRIDGARRPDPAVSADGRTLTFRLGDLLPGSRKDVTYVVEVAAGAKTGKAVNIARATDGNGMASNTARATVAIKELFFRDKTFLAGRVLTGGCSQDDTEMQGLAGVRIYLEDGSYVVTDQNGSYHFEGIEPGIHVVQVDTITLPPGYEMIPCEQSSQFAGRSFSQFVDLQGGTLWQVNFYAAPLPPPTGETTLQLFARLDGEVATFRVVARAHRLPAENLRVTVMLPGSSTYLPGSARHDGEPIPDPPASGGAITWRAPHLEAGATTEFTFQARLEGGEAGWELPARALLTFDSPSARNQRTPLAETRFRLSAAEQSPGEELRLYPRFPSFVATLQETDRAMLEQLADRLREKPIVRLDIVGHTDSQPIAPRSRHIFADNQALAEGRARAVADFLRQRLAVPAEAISVRGLGESMPVADNAQEEGRALNRRVELYLVTEALAQSSRVELTQEASPLQSAATTGRSPAEAPAAAPKPPPISPARPPELTAAWLAAAAPQARIVWPEPDYSPEIASTTIMVQYPVGDQVDLFLNGVRVDERNFDTAKPIPNSDYVVGVWEGVDLRGGRNHIEALLSSYGRPQSVRLERELWFVTEAKNVEFLAEQSTLVADGVTPLTFALRLTDGAGRPLHPGQQVEYRVSSPSTVLADAAQRSLSPAASVGRMLTGADGVAYAVLTPTTRAEEVSLTLLLPGNETTVKTRLKPVPRDWILVGFAAGTVGYNTLTDHLVSAAEAGIDEHGYTDDQIKFFAKGAIQGKWLLTMAYDSDKPDLDGDSLQQIIDPDTYYPLYGDATQQGYEAASARDIYVKLERDQFYALFGDMQTGLTQTELCRYSRSMNGFKAEQQSERFAYTVFAADTRQAFVKDELRGDGTSGRYSLSRKKLVVNSEEVVIETRDRFHNERILKEERLSRHLDYDIDYDAGTLFFKRPVPSKDENFNPVFIVARYETQDSAGANLNYGGRGAVRLLDQKVEIGASLVHEESGAATGDLYGADLTVQLTPQTTLRAEVAGTDVEELDADRIDEAYLAEIAHRGEQLDARAWFRQQGRAFGLGQQNAGTTGLRTYGAEGAWRLTPRWGLAGAAYREDNLATAARRDVGSLEARYGTERFALSAGLREASDRFDAGGTQRSRQLLFGGNWSTPDRKLTLRATHEQSLGGSNNNVDFPTRTMLGADYQLSKSATLFAEQEFTWGEQADTEGTRVGIKATPWAGGEVRSAVEQQIAENDQRVFALFGLGQSWQISRHWSIDLSVDRSHTFMKEVSGERVNDNVPLASGGDDNFTAVSAGAARRAEKWSWWNRLETRQGDSVDKYGVSSGVVGELSDGVSASARLMAFISDSADGAQRDEETLTLGLAYRPQKSRWIFLERLDLSLRSEEEQENNSDSVRIVNHLHASFRVSRKWQTSCYYGLKYTREHFDGERFDGYTDMLAVETRYNLDRRWDIDLHGAVLHSWNSNQLGYSFGPSVGYLVMTNAWISAGYNLAGFEDEDFSDANYTAQGPFLRLRLKFDQNSAKEAIRWLQQF